MRFLVAAWFALEALASINRIARLLPILGVYPTSVWVMIALRAVVTAFQTASAWTLIRNLPPALFLSRATATASAVLLTLELGFVLAPTSTFPAHRWPIVAVYWLITAVVLLWTYRRAARPFP